MREDMAKVLVERPRRGGGGSYRRGMLREWQRLPLDEWPQKERMKHRWGKCPKWLNENLAPLRRFLRSSRGRKWDDVYGEICQQINRKSTVQQHVLQHLMWEVARTTLQIQKLFESARRFRGRNHFYVEPGTGILRELRCYRKRRRMARRDDRIEHAGRHFRRIDGIWYEIEFAPIARGPIPFWDVVLRMSSPSDGELWKCHGQSGYAARKWQLNKREIRRLKRTTERN